MSEFYSSLGLDRAAHRRNDAPWIERRLTLATTRVLLVHESRSLVTVDEPPRAHWLDAAAAAARDTPERRVFLGIDGSDQAWFALRAERDDAPEGTHFADLKRVGPLLDPGDAGVLALARGVAHWHDTHRFCGACGARTRSVHEGWLRRCSREDCARTHFPRTDPAVIVRVVHDDRILLGRQHGWPSKWYSVLAGFVEPGESLEHAVAREVFEESGVVCRNVRYVSAQPWPFPASLMIGFSAEAESADLTVDDVELADAGWFSRQDIHQQVAAGQLRLSPPTSISRSLIDTWLLGS